jgi:hypothetical protein
MHTYILLEQDAASERWLARACTPHTSEVVSSHDDPAEAIRNAVRSQQVEVA